MRVWVPLRRQYAIGIVARLHNEKPDFATREIREVLDTEAVLTPELLRLCGWIHRFYYCSLGEVYQAALPAGLNFVSKKYVRVSDKNPGRLPEPQAEVLAEIGSRKKFELNDAKKRWTGTSLNKAFSKLLKDGFIEVWEEPDLRVTVKKERAWAWAQGKSAETAAAFLKDSSKKMKWEQALERLSVLGLPVRNSELQTEEAITSYTLKKLESDGWIVPLQVEAVPEKPGLEFNPEAAHTLNPGQEEVFSVIRQSIERQEYTSFLLYGITGSGKTEVYIQALKRTLQKGRGGIVLVPEIALTPQTVSRFYKVFGDEIAVLHSRLTPSERLLAWKDLKAGRKRIVIGPRSAIFAPVSNVGLIIIDEEHDASYKQEEPSPRYHARETAIMRAVQNRAVVIMGSATPSMQALHMTAKGKAVYLELTSRHAGAVLPEVEITDLKQYKHAMSGSLSAALYHAVQEALEKKEQIILLFNRRGFASYMQCSDCGHIPQSPECSVSLTYHKQKNILLCHYSGYSRRADTVCEKCGSPNIAAKGSGTQKVEEELGVLFPEAGILRFDRDSTTRKGAYSEILDAFGSGQADILVGTQLVAKGLDFPNVTVAGVVDADTELAFPSFQSSERMFQLLSQVAGRPGRGDKPGKVFIQTYNPETPALHFASMHNYKGFAAQEMAWRKALQYPPFSRLLLFELKGRHQKEVEQAAHLLAEVIHRVLPEGVALGPSPAAIAIKNRNFYWEIILKTDPARGENYIEALLDKIMEVYRTASPLSETRVRININVDSIR